MIHLKCTDFKDAFFRINKYYLLHPEEVAFMDSDKGYMRDVFISCKNTHIDIDISTLGYKVSKWKNLVNNYLSEPDILTFKEKLDNTSALTATFTFKSKKPDKDSCLVGFVIGRTRRKDPWSTLSITYRVCETERKLAVDLILVDKLLHEYLDIDPDDVSIYMPYCYCEAGFINGVFDLFGVRREDINPATPFSRVMSSSYDRWYKEGCKSSQYRTRKVLQELSIGSLNIEPIPAEILNIKEVIK